MMPRDLYAINPTVSNWIARTYPEAKVVEIGGGNGSRYLHRVCRGTYTIEHHPKWAAVLRQDGLWHGKCHLTNGWYDLTQEAEAQLRQADVVVVDGPPGKLRQNIRHNLHYIKPGAVVLFDDTHRAELQAICNNLTTVHGWEYIKEIPDSGQRSTTVLRKPQADA